MIISYTITGKEEQTLDCKSIQIDLKAKSRRLFSEEGTYS